MAIEKRKINVTLASIAMGGGIWSTHFVAMLGLQMDVSFSYDFLITLGSALIAILVVGAALLILHFVKRSQKTMVISGIIVGLGIVIMHYLGMSGIRGTIPQYSLHSILMTIILAAGLGSITFIIAYRQRNSDNILLGTLFFGIAVFVVHFAAMHGTTFLPTTEDVSDKILISNEILAIGISVTTFIICGAFLLNGITFLQFSTMQQSEMIHNDAADLQSVASHDDAIDQDKDAIIKIPFEKDSRSHFIKSDQVIAIRAEGHYTYIYTQADKLFCPWSISNAIKRTQNTNFINCHRSYLINPEFITGFERTKDNGVCFFDSNSSLEKVPVSRSKLKAVQQALGLI